MAKKKRVDTDRNRKTTIIYSFNIVIKIVLKIDDVFLFQPEVYIVFFKQTQNLFC